MVSEEFPFSSAKSLLDDAADWLVELCLPVEHEQRLDDDETCLEQAVANIERAIDVLNAAGTEQVEVDTEIHDGHEMPILETRVTDQACAIAASSIGTYCKLLQAWHRGGDRVEVTADWIANLKGLLPQNFKTRLDSEAAQIDVLEDAYDATLY